MYKSCVMCFGCIDFVFYGGFWWVFFGLLFIELGSSVSVLSRRLNLFLVSIFHVDVWFKKFDTFSSSCLDYGWAWFVLDCEGIFKLDWCLIFIFSLFDSGFDIWAFPESFILKVGGRIGDLCDFLFTVLILVEVLGFSMDIFLASSGNVFCWFSLFHFS